MITLEEARRRILGTIQPLVAERTRVDQAAGRIAAVAIASPINLPPFDNSAMDGYAVRAIDLSAANEQRPIGLRIVGQSPAGNVLELEIQPGECARIFTGSPLPGGVDAVVMQEDTRLPADNPGSVQILSPVRPGENIRLAGEDVRCGAVVLEPGEELHAGRLGLLAAIGVTEVTVHRLPIIGLLATGNELIEPGNPLPPGCIYESNRLMLAAALQPVGASVNVYPLVRDTFDATRSALETAFAECDAVITSGGASVGELDFVKRAFAAVGGNLDFWRVSIKPGKPFLFGRYRDRFLFGLPGNPVSAAVTFLLLVKPAILRLSGVRDCLPSVHHGTLETPVSNPGDRRHFVRVTIDSSGNVRSSGTQASHLLHSLARANGLIDVPPGATLHAGETVKVLRLD